MTVLGELLATMVGHAAAALDPPPSRALVAPGVAVAWDDCCDGQVWVRLVELVPGGQQAQATTMQPCGVTSWRATIGCGVLRCAAVVDDSGTAPTAAVLTAEAVQMTEDMLALSLAIQCEMSTLVPRIGMLRWDPLGPEGGCVGGEWQFSVLLDNERCV